MSEMAMVNFRMDKDLKRSMESVCKDMGLSMTTAFTMFATKVSRERRIPFEVNADPFYSVSNMAALRESIEQANQGKTVVKSMDELERLADE